MNSLLKLLAFMFFMAMITPVVAAPTPISTEDVDVQIEKRTPGWKCRKFNINCKKNDKDNRITTSTTDTVPADDDDDEEEEDVVHRDVYGSMRNSQNNRNRV